MSTVIDAARMLVIGNSELGLFLLSERSIEYVIHYICRPNNGDVSCWIIYREYLVRISGGHLNTYIYAYEESISVSRDTPVILYHISNNHRLVRHENYRIPLYKSPYGRCR